MTKELFRLLGLTTAGGSFHLPEEISESAELIHLSGDLTASMIDSLVHYYKFYRGRDRGRTKETGQTHRQWTNFGVFVKSSVAGLASKRRKDVTVDVDVEKIRWMSLHVDRALLGRVLVNILSNAMKYTFHGTIRVSVLPEDDTFDLEDELGSPQRLLVIVRDTGIGMKLGMVLEQNESMPGGLAAVERLQRLGYFPRFADEVQPVLVRESRKVLSLGIGLRIVADILSLMDDARLVCQSVEGVGSTYILSFRCPIREQSFSTIPEQIQDAGDSAEGCSSSSCRRLQLVIAEDILSNRKILRMFLHRLGYEDSEIAMFENGSLAYEHLCELAETRGDLPSNLVVLTDINMPVMNGLELVARIRRHPILRSTLVYAVSATIDGLDDDDYCDKFELDGRLDKPYALDELREVLDQARDKLLERLDSGDFEADENEKGGELAGELEICPAHDLVRDELTEDAELGIFGVTLRNRRSHEELSLPSCIRQFMLEGAASLIFLLLDGGWRFFLSGIVCNLIGLTGRLCFPKYLGDFEVAKYALCVPPVAYWAGEDAGGWLSYGCAAYWSAVVLNSFPRILVWNFAGFLSCLLTELFALPNGALSVQGTIEFVLLYAVFTTLQFIQISRDLAIRDELENTRLEVALSRFLQKKEDQQRLVQRISHDLRNALSGIHPCLLLLARKTLRHPNYEELRNVYCEIHQAFRFISNGSSQLVEYFRADSGKLYLVEDQYLLHSLIDETLGDLALFANRNSTQFRVENLLSENLSAMVDRQRLQGIIENLVSNAERHCCDGVIHFRTWFDAITSHFHIEVSDSGVGMSAEKLASVFEDPFREKSRHKIDPSLSVGFRLFLDRKFARLMNGDLTLTSDGVGFGTTAHFSALFPDASQERDLSCLVQLPAKTITEEQTVELLVIDDNSVVLKLMEHFCKRLEVGFVGASTVEEGKRIASDRYFHLCLIDVNLTACEDGLALARELRDDGCPNRIVMMSGCCVTLNSLKGEFGVLVKPIGLGELRRAIGSGVETGLTGYSHII